MTEAEIDLNFLCACLREAGELALMQRELPFGSTEHGQMEVELKADRSPVTAVDRQVETLLIERIQARYPDHLILSEESGLHPGLHDPAGTTGFAWALDPIDGTRAFASGLPVWGISAGVLRAGRPYAGGFFLPVTGELYFGTTQEAWYNQHPLRRLESFDPDDPLTFLGVPSEFHLHFKISAPRIRSMGSTAAHLAYVATGAAAGMLTRTTSLWDIAGVLPLAQAAGVELAYLSGRKFDPAELLDGHPIREPLLAGMPAAFDALRRWVQVL
jgi:myo-inositol-1(or 4)-monophosphatase